MGRVRVCAACPADTASCMNHYHHLTPFHTSNLRNQSVLPRQPHGPGRDIPRPAPLGFGGAAPRVAGGAAGVFFFFSCIYIYVCVSVCVWVTYIHTYTYITTHNIKPSDTQTHKQTLLHELPPESHAALGLVPPASTTPTTTAPTTPAQPPPSESPSQGPSHIQSPAGAGAAEGEAQASADGMQRRLWMKLAVNSCINPLTALVRRRNGAVGGDPRWVWVGGVGVWGLDWVGG